MQMKKLEVIEAVAPRKDLISLSDVSKELREILGAVSDEQMEVDLGKKWEGGKLVFQPADESLKPYELPVETFFSQDSYGTR